MQTKRIGPAAAFAACTAIWGSTFLFIRIGNDSVPPLWAATLRLVLATLLLSLLVRLRGGRFPRGATLRTALAYGALQFGGNFALLYWGEKSVPSGIAAVLFASLPLLTLMIARAFGLEAANPRKLAGAFIGIAGVAVIFRGEMGSKIPPLPLLAVVVAACLASLGSVILKRGPAPAPIAANAVGAGVGAVICFSLSLLAGERLVVPLAFRQWFPVVYLAIAGSLGAFVLFAWLLARWEASRAMLISLITPLVAVALGVVTRHERPAPGSLLGTVLVLVGVATALTAASRKRTEAAARPRPAVTAPSAAGSGGSPAGDSVPADPAM